MSPDRPDVTRVVEAVYRIESARIIGALARLVRDVGLAEELAQDALVAALEQWPARGVPDAPGPWLMATAKHRAVDHLRRQENYRNKLALVGTAEALDEEALIVDAIDDHIGDDTLRLLFTACHPTLTTESQVALTLRMLGGLRTGEIARAFLTTEATVSQRILRAKRALTGVAFELPSPAELPSRLAAVLGTTYLIFNEGYAATAGDGWSRPQLIEEALRLGRVLSGRLPGEPEVHGLSALMELQASRLPARTDPAGHPILLADQDRSRWDRLLIRRGLAALARAESLGTLGPYGLQAAIAACHARALTFAATDWPRIAALYRLLAHVAPSAVVELNRAVAVGMAEGPAAALALLDQLHLPGYPHLPAARGDMLARLGRHQEARAAFTEAATLTTNAAERHLFTRRANS
ncbi:sigma-70 family RNA polymerase sigma factor [Dactylosporangium vinaceum]|uniref:RNA polymerase sigma factor n=1 Tax=Dactylosporangium vinaceum TaxID=53362 RepID=A0ABV5MG91_9ACTN|nr:sigma-70 family RNA polymerase sigma factor [Dactylosporangium vinaceum]UAB98782.1 sigma-70 family RNA polymerase sigma factor [Dactylosporangium vinaceum]